VSVRAGQVAVVTGAASGIGRALSHQLAARGWSLAISDLDADGLAATEATCRRLGATTSSAVLDVADRDAVQMHAGDVLTVHGTVHLVINNAGVAYAGRAPAQQQDDIGRVLDTNLRGVIHGSQAFLPHLIAGGGGRIVNVSSLFGLLGMPIHTAYCASKFGVRGYTEALDAELRASRLPVRATCVHPGGVATDIARNASFGRDQDADGLGEVFAKLARTSPEDAAATIIRGVERGRSRIIVGTDARIMDLLTRLAGGWSPLLVAAVSRRLLHGYLGDARGDRLGAGLTRDR
jgi:NAD(P)-dependent dehydrogenase (short-subunit alcohol dehydrogenase family)